MDELDITIRNICCKTHEGLPQEAVMQLLLEAEDQMIEYQIQLAEGCIEENILIQQEHIVEQYRNKIVDLGINIRFLEKCFGVV